MNDFDVQSDPVRAVLLSPALSRRQKIDTLLQMAYDAREQDVATEEGMTIGVRTASLSEIQRALRQLGAADVDSGAKQ